MKKQFLSHTALACIGLSVFAAPVFAGKAQHQVCDKDESFCERPEKVGKHALDSRAEIRKDGELAPSVEYRDVSIERPPYPHRKPMGCDHVEHAHGSDLPFRISIDGEPVGGAVAPNSADVTRCKDVALAKADIQVRFDPLESSRVLNVNAIVQSAVRGEVVRFVPHANYRHFIHKAELRIFKPYASLQKKPMDIVRIHPSWEKDVVWKVPTGSKLRHVHYVLRVYDKDGNFDETKPMKLRFTDQQRLMDDQDSEMAESLIGYGEDNLSFANIPVSGGIVTVNGTNLQEGTQVYTMGAGVPVDDQGRFAYKQILPAGSHSVDVTTVQPDGSKAEFSRSLYIPDQDWFYVGVADLTIGNNRVSGPAALVTGQNTRRNRGEAYVDGRLGFYAKGKVKGEWLLTASADTQEQPLEDLFSNFTDKDPRSLLQRIDPNKYYQVYGDDSTTVEDAPTQGNFYVKLQKQDTHVLWGNFQTKITGTDLVNYSRTLYGANAEYTSERSTFYGERITEVDVFAADPGSISSLEEYRGTGGSLYYLQGQDVVIGSERLRIETRDRDSDIVLDSQSLVYGQDYEINYLQGRVLLREPLSSSSASDSVVQTGSLSGHPQYLVAGYEFAPSVSSIENLTKGGRVSHWFNDYFRLGASVFDQNGTGFEQTLGGVDLIARYAPGTYLKLEQARSDGAGSGAFTSFDGGFSFNVIDQDTSEDIDANAFRGEIAVDLSEVSGGKYQGQINAYSLSRDEGFSAPGQLTSEDILQHGITIDMPITQKVAVGLKFDHKEGDDSGDLTTGEISANVQVNSEGSVDLAVRHDDRNVIDSFGGNSETLSEDGERTDLAVRYNYEPLNEDGEKKRYDVYGLLQATVNKSGDRDRNNRAGLGGHYDITDRLGINAEASTGNLGFGGLLGLDFAKSDRTSYYMNYEIDSDRTDIGSRSRNSSFTLGGKSRYTDSLSVFAEERYQTFDEGASGLIHSFGLDFAASDQWTWGGRFENGVLSDPDSGDTDRTAVSLTTGYHNDRTKYSGSAEMRLEENDLSEFDRRSWLTRHTMGYQTSEDWRLLADFDLAISDSGLSSNLDADFIEIGLGYAYRPIDNDRLNALVRYEFLQDNASPGQLNASRTSSASDFEQRSHVVSADMIYDVTPKLAIGGKIGYRFGEIRDVTVADSDFFDSRTLLLVGRADWHVVKTWDILGELRMLDVSEADDTRVGALLGVYRHVNQNVKVGAGYNFTDFSDDLTDLDYDSRGAFFNILGKF